MCKNGYFLKQQSYPTWINIINHCFHTWPISRSIVHVPCHTYRYYYCEVCILYVFTHCHNHVLLVLFLPLYLTINVYFRYIESGCYRGLMRQARNQIISTNLGTNPERIFPWNVYTDADFQLKQNQPSSHSRNTGNDIFICRYFSFTRYVMYVWQYCKYT